MSHPRAVLLRHSWLQLGLWLIAVILLNHAASAAFARFDLTADGDYTLSPAARQVMSRLERPLVARMYFTGGLEAPYNNHEQAVRDKLEELRAYSGGRMEIQSVDPTGDQDAMEEAERFGVFPIQYRFRDHDRVEMKSVYMGVALVYGQKQEPVNPIATLQTLEYELVRAVYKLTTDAEESQVVGYLQGNGEPDLSAYPADNPLGQLRNRLAQSYELRPVVLGGDEGVPEDVDAMLVIGPQSSVPDRVQYQLDQYLLQGGPIAFFVGNIRPDWRTMRASEVRHDLNALLGHHGVILRRDALIDRTRNEQMRLPVRVGEQTRMVSLNHPLLPVTTNLKPESPVVRGLDRAVAPFVSSLAIAEDLPPGVEGQVWIETEPSSASLKGLVHVRPDVFATPTPGEEAGPFPIAVALTGSFTSAFADRPIPAPPGRAAEDPRNQLEAAARVLDGAPSRMVIVSSADFVANNLPFVLNTVDWMLQSDELISIRSRAVERDALEPPPPDRLLAWKLGIALLPTLPLLGLGLVVALRARRNR